MQQPLLTASPDALNGLMKIAEAAMPDSFFQTDRRVRAARRVLERLDRALVGGEKP